MRKLLMAVSAALLSLFAVAGGKSGEWYQEWVDDFTGDSLDTKVWSKCTRGTSDWENYMSSADSLYSVRDGVLTLRGVVNGNTDADTARFLTGGVWTFGGKAFVPPCRIEVTARLQAARGAWPAIWLLPFDRDVVKWPAGGEIDMMERLNHDSIAYQTVHSYYTLKLGLDSVPPHFATGKIRPEEFNTYAVEITADSLAFYINDNHTFSYPRIATDKPGQYPFMIPMGLLIDMQLGGSWVGAVDPSELPVKMEVDAVRYYRRK